MRRDNTVASHSHTKRRRLFYTAAVAILVAGSLVPLFVVIRRSQVPYLARLCWDFVHGTPRVGIQVFRPRLAEISRITSLRFPARTKLLGSQLQVWLDSTLVAKMEMPRSDAEAFLSSPPFAGKVSTTDRRAVVNSAPFPTPPSWWDPDSVAEFACSEDVIWHGAKYERHAVLVNLGQGRKAVVYLLWEGD
jgi:hypothetical protein